MLQWHGAYQLRLVAQAICDVLAEGREGEPGGAPPAKLSLEHVVALKPLLPLNNAFQLLIQPLPARGLGLRLKRALKKPKPGKLCEGAWSNYIPFEILPIPLLPLSARCCMQESCD